jgi:hypothetical protein
MPKVTWQGAEAYSLAGHPRDGVQAGTAVEAFRFTTASPHGWGWVRFAALWALRQMHAFGGDLAIENAGRNRIVST